MTETTPELLDKFFDNLLKAPEGQMSARLRDQTRTFLEGDPTLQERYDYLVELAITSCCETSSFVKVLCDLRPFYERPGGPRDDWPEMTIHSTSHEVGGETG